MRVGALVVVGIGMLGCHPDLPPSNIQVTGEWAAALNRSLYYLPFAKNGASCGSAPADPRGVTERNTVRLLPGMKLSIHWTNTTVPRAATTGREATSSNSQPPIIGSYDWVVPEHAPDGTYASTDFFMLAELLTVWTEPSGSPGVDGDLLAEYRKGAAALGENDFAKELGSKYLCPIVSSLRVQSRSEVSSMAPFPCTAGSIRELFGPGSQRELAQPEGRQRLVFKNPVAEGCPDIGAFDRTVSYFDQPVTSLGTQRNRYLDPKANANPTYLEPMIAVRIEPEVMSRHVPIYWSVEDLERRLGVHVVAVRRRLDFLGQLDTAKGPVNCVGWAPKVPASTTPVAPVAATACGICTEREAPPPISSNATLCPDLASPGGYVTLYVRPRQSNDTNGFGARAVLRVADVDNANARKNMLLAHGDVIVTERLQETDAPGTR